MQIKADGKGGWKLLGAQKGTKLRRVTIIFPSVTSRPRSKATNHIAGPAKVNIRVEHANGDFELISDVSIDWT